MNHTLKNSAWYELLLMFWALSVKLLKTTDFSRIKLRLGSELRWNKALQEIRHMAFCSFGWCKHCRSWRVPSSDSELVPDAEVMNPASADSPCAVRLTQGAQIQHPHVL